MNAWSAPRPTPAQTSCWTRNSEFLVYLVPVGAISQERYATYVALLQQHRVLPISALTRPGGYAAELSPFKSFSWASAGAIRFRFVSTAERVESYDGEDVHAWNRPIGVIGICHCPSTPSLKDAYAQFAASIKHFPSTLVQKCFAFEHQFDEGTVEQVAALSNLVMFPVHHELDVGCSTVSLHLQVVLDTIAVTILMSLESTIRAAMRQQAQSHHHSLPFQSAALEFGDMASFLLDTNVEPMHAQANQANASSSIPLLSTPSQAQSLQAAISSMASTAVSTTASAFTSPFTDSRGRRRQIARHRKLFGDYSVLLDCIPDALEHYATALELLKDEERKSNGASGDTLWLAAALEGYVYCLFLESKDQFVVEIIEKASEAVALYAKAGVSDLECQLIEKTGWYCVAVASQLIQGSSKGKEKVNEAIWIKRLLWDTIDRGLAVFPELHMQRQIEFVIEASRMLESVGHRRRMAFFLHEAVTLLIGRNNMRPVSSVISPSLQNSTVQRQRDLQAALLLERMTAARLGITDDLSSAHAPGNGNREWEVTTLYRSKKTRRGVQIDPAPMTSHEQVWLVLRLHVLRQLLTISKMLGEPYLVGKYCIQLLQMLPWCDSIASHTLVTPSKRTAMVSTNNRKPQTGATSRTGGARTPPVDQVQRPFTSQRSAAQSAERQGLFAKTSVYFTPPSSVETKAKRYFTLAGSPSATMSSAAASLSSTIASTPRVLLATPRQQFSAAVNAISTKASPAFASFSQHSHGHASPHSTHSSSSSPNVSGGMSGSGDIGLSPNPGTAGSSENGFERAQANGVTTSNSNNNNTSSSSIANGSSTRTGGIQDRMFEALPVWNIRSKEEVVKMEKNILTLMETECSSLRPSEQVKLPTFLGVEKIHVLAKLDHPFFPKVKALELYASKSTSATGDSRDLLNAPAKSDFFYSPFEKQQQEKHRAAATQENNASSDAMQQESSVFPVYEKIELEMTVSNPFGVAIAIQQATAWVVYAESNGDNSNQHESTTAAVECYPCSFELAPYEKQKSVILGIQPLRTGAFRVRGCFLKVLNLKTSFALDAAVELRVVGKLPLASLSLCEFGSLAHDSSHAQTASSAPSLRERRDDVRISMFSSETKQCELRIRNVGPNVISKCHLRATVLRKQMVRKTMVVFDNLTASVEDHKPTSHHQESVIETDSLTLRCRLRAAGGTGEGNLGDAVLVPMENGDVVSIQFEILLLQKSTSRQHRFAGEDEPLEEEEEIVWSFVYADDPDGGGEAGDNASEVFYRETKLALKLVSLPSLKLSSVSLLPSTPEWIPAGSRSLVRGDLEDEEQPAVVSSAVMDNSHFLLVVEVENPTETAFCFRMWRRSEHKTEQVLADDNDDGDNEFSSDCDVEIGRKCSRRLAIEVPRISSGFEKIGDGGDMPTVTSTTHKRLASLLNALVEMQWETYFGTNGRLLFDDSLWTQTLHHDQVGAAKRELILPEFAFEIAVPGLLPSPQELSRNKNEDGDGGDGIPMLDSDENKTAVARSPFVFFQGSQLSCERRQLIVRVLEFIPITFAIRNVQQKTGRSSQVSIDVHITQEGEAEQGDDESSLADESVIVVGMLSRDVAWADDSEDESAKSHEIQVLFLSRGDFRVSICGHILDEANQVREIWCHQPLYICASE